MSKSHYTLRTAIAVLLFLALTLRPTWAQDAQRGADGVGDPYFPQLGNEGYDVQHYTIDLAVDMETNIIEGTTTIDALATQDLSAFNLDFIGLDISRILVDGSTASFSREGQELTVTPATLLLDDAVFSVAVTYRGVPEPLPAARSDLSPAGWVRYKSGVFVTSLPDGAMSWFPCNNHPSDKATYTFRITVAKPFSVAANGTLSDEIDNGDTRTFVWTVRDPMVSYGASISIAEFKEYRQDGPNGLEIVNFIPPTATDDFQRYFVNVPDMIAYFSDTFGPFPFESFGYVIPADLQFTGGFSNHSRPTVSLNRVGDELVVAHELSHQWWGNSVSIKTWKDGWLREGFAHYSEYLWLEHKGARFGMQFWLSQQSTSTAAPITDPTRQDFQGRAIYERGALTLHALRQTVGDAIFFDILRTYYDRFKYSNADTADFITVAEEVSGQDLNDFFNLWLFSTDTPPRS